MAGQRRRQDGPAGSPSQAQFKVCDLCGALNRAIRSECFICGWRGHFATDAESIYRASLGERLPRGAADALPAPRATIAPPDPPTPRPAGLFTRLRLFLGSLLRRGRGA